MGGGRADALLHACGGAFALFRALAGQIAGEAYDEKLGDQVHLLSPVRLRPKLPPPAYPAAKPPPLRWRARVRRGPRVEGGGAS